MNDFRLKYSEYMQWAKENAHITYNLAASGLMNYPEPIFNPSKQIIEISGDDHYGYAPLVDAIADKYKISTEMVFTTIGSSMANYITMALLIDTGDDIIIEHPTYELLISTAKNLGANVIYLPRPVENQYLINPDDLKSCITQNTKLVILTNLHNPSSALTDNETLKEIGKIAKKVGAYVLIDEVYLDSAFSNSVNSSIHTSDNFIVTSSLTKVYGLSGLRCGWTLAQPDVIKQLWRLSDLMYVKHALPAEILSVNAFSKLDKIKQWAKLILEKNRIELKEFFKNQEDLEVDIFDYGMTVFPKLKNIGVDQLNTTLIKKYDTIIAPGRFFGMPDHLRIGYGNDPEKFREGLHRLGEAISKTRK